MQIEFKFVKSQTMWEDDEYVVFVDGVERKDISIQSGSEECYYVVNEYKFDTAGECFQINELKSGFKLETMKNFVIKHLTKKR